MFASFRKSGSRNTMVTTFSPKVEIRPVRACAMHPAIIIAIIGTVRSLLTWLWGRYHVSQNWDSWDSQNAFLVFLQRCFSAYEGNKKISSVTIHTLQFIKRTIFGPINNTVLYLVMRFLWKESQEYQCQQKSGYLT